MLLPLMEGMLTGRRLQFDVAPLRLPVNIGTSLSLLVNELVSNAVKHGAGDIALKFAVEAGTVELTVCDQGVGFPEGFDPVAQAHTGLELIQSVISMDLRGDVSFINQQEGGACVKVTFPVPQPPLEANSSPLR